MVIHITNNKTLGITLSIILRQGLNELLNIHMKLLYTCFRTGINKFQINIMAKILKVH